MKKIVFTFLIVWFAFFFLGCSDSNSQKRTERIQVEFRGIEDVSKLDSLSTLIGNGLFLLGRSIPAKPKITFDKRGAYFYKDGSVYSVKELYFLGDLLMRKRQDLWNDSHFAQKGLILKVSVTSENPEADLNAAFRAWRLPQLVKTPSTPPGFDAAFYVTF